MICWLCAEVESVTLWGCNIWRQKEHTVGGVSGGLPPHMCVRPQSVASGPALGPSSSERWCSQEPSPAHGTKLNLSVSLHGNEPATQCISMPRDLARDLSRKKPNVVMGVFVSSPKRNHSEISSKFLLKHHYPDQWSVFSTARRPARPCVLLGPHVPSCPLCLNRQWFEYVPALVETSLRPLYEWHIYKLCWCI